MVDILVVDTPVVGNPVVDTLAVGILAVDNLEGGSPVAGDSLVENRRAAAGHCPERNGSQRAHSEMWAARSPRHHSH